MAGILERLGRIWRRRLGRKARRVQSPLQVLQHHLDQMARSADALKQSSLKLGQMQGELRHRLHQLDRLIQRYDEQARKAYKLKQLDLAELAIREKLKNQAEQQHLQGDIDELGVQITSLEARKEGLINRMEIYQTKREELELRLSASRAQLQAGEVSLGLSEGSLMLEEVKEALAQAEREIQAMQARVEATRELEQERRRQALADFELEPAAGQSSQAEEQSAVSRELERIKRELG